MRETLTLASRQTPQMHFSQRSTVFIGLLTRLAVTAPSRARVCSERSLTAGADSAVGLVPVLS